jgi:D-proline reductase (dithiol) PrdB
MHWSRIKNQLIARVITRVPSLAKRFVASYTPWESEDIPWAPFTKPLSRCIVALVTTAGVHHRDQQPFNMNDRDGDPSCRIIDLNRPPDSLMITHDYYDHADADRDRNIVFPVERMRELAATGVIGALAGRNYSFMGHITGAHILTLVNKTAPEAARSLKQDGVDAVLLTPG